MGLKDCQIELDNPWNTYYAGQTVNGKVTFTFDSPKRFEQFDDIIRKLMMDFARQIHQYMSKDAARICLDESVSCFITEAPGCNNYCQEVATFINSSDQPTMPRFETAASKVLPKCGCYVSNHYQCIFGIVINFSGESETKWSQTETKTDQEGKQYESTTNLTGQEEYFQIQYYLLGGKNSKEIDLDAGTHVYPFTCALPPTLPSSFEGEWGFVRYTIKVTLDRPWKFDQDIKMAFTVISPVDLNTNPRVKDPFKLELEKTFCCFCCASGPLSVIVHIPVTGFVSGQTIPLTIECDNASNVGVESVKLILRKLLAFHVHTPRRETKKKKEVISEISVGPVEGGNSQTWHQNIQIPPLPPSNLVNCGIIDIDYDIKVEAVVSGPHANLDGNIPVVLGTVPLNSFQPPTPYTDNPSEVDPSMLPTQPVSPASPPNGTGGALGWNIADGGDSLYPNIPPPTFAEATFRAPNISNKNDSEFTRFVGPSDYAPRYPTYAFTPSAPPADL